MLLIYIPVTLKFLACVIEFLGNGYIILRLNKIEL
jgi:hypothetical protein